MGLAFAHLGWSPETFWGATFHELYSALEALSPDDDQPDPWYEEMRAAGHMD